MLMAYLPFRFSNFDTDQQLMLTNSGGRGVPDIVKILGFLVCHCLPVPKLSLKAECHSIQTYLVQDNSVVSLQA